MLKPRRLFCDWHMPGFLDNLNLQTDYFVDKMAAIDAQTLLMMVKTAFGNCLYPTDVGYRTIALGKRDLLQEIFDHAVDKGIEVYAYYNMLLNDYLAKDHPEWLQVDCEGKTLKSFYYHVFCMNNKAFREHLIAHLHEILSRYSVKGMFFDIQYFNTRGCFCSSCRQAFEHSFNYPLDPHKFTDIKHWLDLVTFQRESRRDFITTATESCRKLQPGIEITWNGSGSPAMSAVELDAEASFLSSEAHPPCYSECSMKAKWMRGSGKEFAFTLPETISSWGDWTLMNAHTMKMLCSIAMANGGSIELNHVPIPCGDYGGKVFPAVYDVLSETLDWVKTRESVCIGKATVPVAAILHSVENIRLKQAFEFQSQYSENDIKLSSHDHALGLENTRLASQIFDEIHIPFDLIYSEKHLKNLSDYEILVLPNVGHISDELCNKIREYVNKGGNILATYNTSLLDENGCELEDFKLADIFGASFQKYSTFSVNYLDQFAPCLSAVMPDIPFLIKDGGYNEQSYYPAIYCKTTSEAAIKARFTEPILEADLESGKHIYHDHSPPGRKTEWPSIIVNRYGKGRSIFMPFELFRTYQRYGGLRLRDMLKSICTFIGVGHKVDIDASTAVQTILTQDEHSWFLHLINLAKENSSVLLHNDTIVPNITCKLQPPWPVKKIVNALTGEPIPFTGSDGQIQFNVKHLRDHSILQISKT